MQIVSFITAKLGSNFNENQLRNNWEIMTPPSRNVKIIEQSEKIIRRQAKLYVKGYQILYSN